MTTYFENALLIQNCVRSLSGDAGKAEAERLGRGAAWGRAQA